jgi:hypothetical protein
MVRTALNIDEATARRYLLEEKSVRKAVEKYK